MSIDGDGTTRKLADVQNALRASFPLSYNTPFAPFSGPKHPFGLYDSKMSTAVSPTGRLMEHSPSSTTRSPEAASDCTISPRTNSSCGDACTSPQPQGQLHSPEPRPETPSDNSSEERPGSAASPRGNGALSPSSSTGNEFAAFRPWTAGDSSEKSKKAIS